MALVRILVDGYSLLHGWPELASGRPRHSAAARDELVRVLTHYRDAVRTPITLVFDGATPKASRPGTRAQDAEVEILYSKSGQSADQIIERAAHRLSAFGEVLVVTDDHAERDTVMNFGAMISSCANFVDDIEAVLNGVRQDLRRLNARERRQFKRCLER